MSRIIFNLAAKCDAAGRSQNQDNYWVCPDLTKWNAPTDKVLGTDEDVELSEKGALLVVADGMGGMNAGEVASKLVIEGIKKKFSNIPDSLLSNEAEIMSFIHSAIVESDESIKKYAKEHREAEGLGSTIVLLWLLNGRAFCGWCGDSRIYRFNPNNELVRLSHDHSYVQSLVDEGKITEEEAFDHPDGNIISKALGDNGNKAEPEIRVYDVYSRDVFLLCSDGLCGLLQDTEINDIIQETCTSSKDSLDALWKKGEKAGWSDNATIDLLCVVEGGKPAKGRPDGYPKIARKPIERKDGSNKPQIVSGSENVFAKILKPPYLYILAVVALCLLCLALYNVFGLKDGDENTNHEFNIEMPNNVDNNSNDQNNTVNQQDNSSSTLNTQGGHNNNNTGGRTNSQTNNNSGHGNVHPNGSNNNHSTGQNPQQGNGNHQGGNPINQGVINQLPQNGNNGTNHPNPSSEQRPSPEYLQFFNNVLNDYNKASSAWNTIKKQQYKTTELENKVFDFTDNIDKNINELVRDQANYNALKDKGKIQSFKNLRDDIKHNWNKYGYEPPRGRRQNYQNHNQYENQDYGNSDDMYNM